MPTKKCRKCGITKTLDNFYKRKGVPDGLRSYCKDCDRAIERNLRYGLSEDRYLEMYEDQNGKCAICKQEDDEGKSLCVDHDHSCCSGRTSCGKCVRALICGRCNKALGIVKDDISTLEEMTNYLLRKYNA